jgi:hypothetical protein
MKLHRKKPPKHATRVTIPHKGLPTPAKIHKQVREARARAGRRQ